MSMTPPGTTAPGTYGTSGAPGSVPSGSPDGTGASAAERPRGLLRSGFGLIGPRHGRHVLSVEQVDSLALPIGDDGVVIGVDAGGQPAVLGLNRPTPYDVVLIGGLWTAQVLALRAAATGARVAVETGRAQAWMQMVHAMGGGQNGMSVHDVGRVPPQGASAGNPVLVVRDCGMRPPRGRVVAGPWQSILTLLPYLSPVAPRLLRQARLVGVQRVSPDEAAEIGRALALPRGDVESLPTLTDGVTLWCADRDRQYVMTQPTDAETGLFGTPRRMD
ncbi:hypothetical protein OHB41_32740 [Streptomyces sp. NBC_01571]|uniref:hypothetical protein n=1 Tax=Streptomyces sp. NBC_01571 TaxID=2975883 RepID=UPI0022585663|nr:hypothetical protein [Streptomyces sp. NBC_01571]MCX4577872.1 hypothetical protein [Streptomyces sp. NBC_01571]